MAWRTADSLALGNDLACSARFQIAKGWAYRLYEKRDYSGRHEDLVGTGALEELPKLRKVAGNASSSRFVKLEQ